MFRQTWPDGIKSDQEFSIGLTDRFDLEYKEYGKAMTIEGESGDVVVVYTSTIKQWKPPHESEPISKEERQQIITNIKAAMDFANWKYSME